MSEDAGYLNWLIQYNVRSSQQIKAYDMVLPRWPDPAPFSLLRDRIPREPSREQQRLAEERDRREWIEGIRRRLGLVTEVHRCHVERSTCGPQWGWSCLRPDCGEWRVYRPTQAQAFAEALAHARSFIPKPPGEEPLSELDWAVYRALSREAARQRIADEAALAWRIEMVTGQVGEALAGLLPDGMRFEWSTDGE